MGPPFRKCRFAGVLIGQNYLKTLLSESGTPYAVLAEWIHLSGRGLGS